MTVRPQAPHICVVKVGGSLVTDKTRDGCVHEDRIAAIGSVLAEVARKKRLVVVMGGGSVGHHAARLYGVDRGLVACNRASVHRMPVDMYTLKGKLAGAIGAGGGAALPLQETSIAHVGVQGLRLSMGPILAALDRGFTPILSGGLVFDDGRGICPLNGDLVPAAMLDRDDIILDRVVMLSDVAGLLDRDGSVVPTVRARDTALVSACRRPTAPGDVTGGMSAKIEACQSLAARGVACVIATGIGLTPARLCALLAGHAEGATEIIPDPPADDDHPSVSAQ